uniref:Uncharacterized protein n=1 Tax=Oryza meridionalis TaxID=40149 RepID=A0A0E0CI20_9ORYZ
MRDRTAQIRLGISVAEAIRLGLFSRALYYYCFSHGVGLGCALWALRRAASSPAAGGDELLQGLLFLDGKLGIAYS